MYHLICLNPALDRTLIMESVEKGKVNRPKEVREFPGGKSFNVAYALNYHHNKEFVVHTLLGSQIGKHVKALAAHRDISVTSTETQVPTRICSILVDPSIEDVYPIYEKGEVISKEVLSTFTHSLMDSLSTDDKVIFSGSLMSGIPENYMRSIIEKIQGKNVFVGIDSSGTPLVEAYQAHPDFIKINDEEFSDLFPTFTGSSIEDYLLFLKEHRSTIPNLFIITLGAEGVLAKIGEEFFHVYADKISVKNPVASGDFFLGTFLHYYFSNSSIENTLKNSVAFSTANCLNWYPEVFPKDLKKTTAIVHCKKLS